MVLYFVIDTVSGAKVCGSCANAASTPIFVGVLLDLFPELLADVLAGLMFVVFPAFLLLL